MQKVSGPTSDRTRVYMKMNAAPHNHEVDWLVSHSYEDAALTRVNFDQGFYTWLVAYNTHTGKKPNKKGYSIKLQW